MKWKMVGEDDTVVNNFPQGPKSSTDKADNTPNLNGGTDASSSTEYICKNIKETELHNGSNTTLQDHSDGITYYNGPVKVKAEVVLAADEEQVSKENVDVSASQAANSDVQIKVECVTTEDSQHVPPTGLSLTAGSDCSICILMGKSESVSHICVDCKDLLCNSCATKHTFSRYTINHKLVTFSAETWESVDPGKAGGMKEKMCMDHPHEQLTFFCEECICFACKVCLQMKHLDHPFVDADATLLVRKNDLHLLQKVVQEKIVDLKNNLEDNNKFMRELKQKEIKEITTVQQIVSEMIKEMKEKEEMAIQEITTEFGRLQNVGVKENKDIGTSIHCLNEVRSWTDMLLAKSKDNQDFLSLNGMVFKSFIQLLKNQEHAETISLATIPTIEQSKISKSLYREPLFDIHKSHQKPDPIPTRKRYIYLDFISDNPLWIGELNIRMKGSADIPGNLVKLHLNRISCQAAACSDEKQPQDLQNENLNSDGSTQFIDSLEKCAASSTIVLPSLRTRDKSVALMESRSQTPCIEDDRVTDKLFVDLGCHKSKADTSHDKSPIKRRKLIEILDNQNPKGRLKGIKKKYFNGRKKHISLSQTNKTMKKAELYKWPLKPTFNSLSDKSVASGDCVRAGPGTQNKVVHANVVKNTDLLCKVEESKCDETLSTDGLKLRLTPAYRLDVRLPTDEMDPKISGIAFIGQNRFAVSDFNNNKIKAFFTSGELWNEWHAEKPKYISFVTGRLAWSSRNRVTVMNVKLNASVKATWAIQVAAPEQEVLPHPITSFGNSILIGNGHYLQEVKFFSYKNDYVAVNKIVPKLDTGDGIRKVQNICGGVKGKTILCNWDHKSAVFVDAEGKASATYTERNHNPTCLPMGIYVPKKKGVVFLLDCTGHRLLLLDANAKLLQEWSTLPAVSSPWSLSGDNEGELFITGVGPFVSVFSYEPCEAGITEGTP